jgi:SnoaL-like domain
MATHSLETTVARLAAIEDLKQLKARYCAYCDDHYNPEGIAGMFIEDGVWDGGREFGRHVGRAAIRSFFAGVSGQILFAAHLVMNPIISIDGERAHGKWRLIMPCTVRDTAGAPEARWLLSAYDEDYVQHAGAWYFSRLTVVNQFYAAHSTGWAIDTSTSINSGEL